MINCPSISHGFKDKGESEAWFCPPTHFVIFMESSLPWAWITVIITCTD